MSNKGTWDSIAASRTATATVVKGGLNGVAISIPQATTVVVKELVATTTDPIELLQGDGKLYAVANRLMNTIPVDPSDNVAGGDTLVNNADYTFSGGVLTIKKDTGVNAVAVSARGAGKDCKWQTSIIAPSHEVQSGLILTTTHAASRKHIVVTNENLPPSGTSLDKLVPLDGLQLTGRTYSTRVGGVGALPTAADYLTITLTAGKPTTFTVTATGGQTTNYFADASSAGNIQVRSEGNTLHVTVLGTVNPADALQIRNVKFQVV